MDKRMVQFQLLKNATLSVPFDLMSFENLNSITLSEMRRYNQNSEQGKEEDDQQIINNGQTFGVKGCKFGREAINNYSYPD